MSSIDIPDDVMAGPSVLERIGHMPTTLAELQELCEYPAYRELLLNTITTLTADEPLATRLVAEATKVVSSLNEEEIQFLIRVSGIIACYVRMPQFFPGKSTIADLVKELGGQMNEAQEEDVIEPNVALSTPEDVTAIVQQRRQSLIRGIFEGEYELGPQVSISDDALVIHKIENMGGGSYKKQVDCEVRPSVPNNVLGSLLRRDQSVIMHLLRAVAQYEISVLISEESISPGANYGVEERLADEATILLKLRKLLEKFNNSGVDVQSSIVLDTGDSQADILATVLLNSQVTAENVQAKAIGIERVPIIDSDGDVEQRLSAVEPIIEILKTDVPDLISDDWRARIAISIPRGMIAAAERYIDAEGNQRLLKYATQPERVGDITDGLTKHLKVSQETTDYLVAFQVQSLPEDLESQLAERRTLVERYKSMIQDYNADYDESFKDTAPPEKPGPLSLSEQARSLRQLLDARERVLENIGGETFGLLSSLEKYIEEKQGLFSEYKESVERMSTVTKPLNEDGLRERIVDDIRSHTVVVELPSNIVGTGDADETTYSIVIPGRVLTDGIGDGLRELDLNRPGDLDRLIEELKPRIRLETEKALELINDYVSEILNTIFSQRNVDGELMFANLFEKVKGALGSEDFMRMVIAYVQGRFGVQELNSPLDSNSSTILAMQAYGYACAEQGFDVSRLSVFFEPHLRAATLADEDTGALGDAIEMVKDLGPPASSEA